MSPDKEFTAEQVRDDGGNRVAKTGLQVSGGSALVIVGEWLAQQAGWHSALPPRVNDAMVVLVSIGVAAATNWRRLRAK